MLIQRRSSSSTISTRGSAGPWGSTTPRARAARRKRGLGRLGIGSKWVVQHGISQSCRKPSLPSRYGGEFGFGRCIPAWLSLFCGADITARIERGGGNGPLKPRQPPSHAKARRGKVPIPSDHGPEDVTGSASASASQRQSGGQFRLGGPGQCPRKRFSARNV